MKLQKLFLSYLGIGFIPFAPGTWGSLASLPLLFLWAPLDFFNQLALYFSLLFISLLITHRVQQNLGVFDPSWIVVDEVLGMLTAWLFFPHTNIIYLLILFVLFRLFDIIKVWPANLVDRKMKSGVGTILDDIISGLYVGLILFSLRTFFPALAKALQIL